MWLRIASLSLAIVLGGSVLQASAEEPKRILGVFFAGCEEVCEGFKNRIAEGGLSVELVIRDIGQDKNRLPELVQEARSMRADLVLTYGTSVTLGMVGTLDDQGDPNFLHETPVVFTLVSDPFGSRIALGFEGSGRANVTGTFNRVPEDVNVEVIRQYDPTFNKLGLLYNSNEPNSIIKMQELEALAPKLGFELVAIELDPGNEGSPDPSTIPIQMAELQDRGVRWLYMGSSNFLLLNADLLTSTAVDHGIAVLSPYEALVRESQALLSIAARFEDVGKLAADHALRILRDGEKPADLPIARATDFAYVVNMDVAAALDLFPPFAFLQVAETVKHN